jgi:hypothetical protein
MCLFVIIGRYAGSFENQHCTLGVRQALKREVNHGTIHRSPQGEGLCQLEEGV